MPISLPAAPHALRFIDNDGVSLALESRGSGPNVLLFAHGWISSRRMWYDVLDHLDPARFTAHLLDFRGNGLSDRTAAGHDLDGYASDLRAAIRAVDRPLTLVAHSMGGKIAQYVALDPPPAVERMVLVAPGSARSVVLGPRHRALAVDAFGSRAKIEQFQRAAMARPVSPDAMERITSDALIAARESWFGWYDHGRTADFGDRLHEIRLPAFVLAADRDPLAPPATVRRDVGAAIAGAVVIALRGVGHNIPVEVPGDVATLIERVAGSAGGLSTTPD